MNDDYTSQWPAEPQWPQQSPPLKRKRRKTGCAAVLMLLLVLGGAAVLLSGVFGDSLREGWNPLSTQTTMQPAPTRAPRMAGEPPQLPLQGRVRSHYQTLNAQEKEAYDTILAALPAFPDSIEIPKLAEDGISNVFFAILRDNPMVFQLSAQSVTRTSGDRAWFQPAYLMTAEEYQERCVALERVCAEIAAGIPEDATEFEAELIIHDAIVRRCEYSYTGDADENTAFGALVLGKAACEGYSRAMMLLLDQQGIDSCIVMGDATNSVGETSRHAWNKVRIGGAWYHVDATWDDPVGEEGAASKGLLHSYLNLNDVEMGLTHEIIPDDRPCTATEANYFAVKGLLFKEIDRDAETLLAQALAEAVNNGDYLLEFRCTGEDAYNAAVERLFKDQRIYRVLSNANLALKHKISTRHVAYTEVEALRILQIIPVLE